MRPLILVLMLFVCGFCEDVLFIGNSRTSGINDTNAQYIATGLGYSTYANRGHGGMTTVKFLLDLPTDLAEVNPKVVILCDLQNDYVDWQRNNTERNLDSILLLCKQAGVNDTNFILVQTATNGLTYDTITTVLNKGPNNLSKHKKMFSYEFEWALKNKIKFAQWKHKIEDYRLARIDMLDSACTWVSSDEVHFNDSGEVLLRNAILQSKVINDKSILWGKSKYAGSWKTWILSTAVVDGDIDTGNIIIASTGGSMASPVMHCGHYQKIITINPTLTKGSNVTIQWRGDFWDFKRNNATKVWTTATSNVINTKYNFFQFRLVSTVDSTIVSSVNYKWVNNAAAKLDTLYFGNRDGMIKGWHKDASISSASPNRSYGNQPNVSTAGNVWKGIIRFNFAYDIPSNANIISANLHVFGYQTLANTFLIKLHELKTDNGSTREWSEFGETVSIQHEATWNTAQADTIAPVYWAGGGAISSADIGDSVSSLAFTGNSLGKEFVFDLKAHIQKNLGNYEYGGLVTSDTNTTAYVFNFCSQNYTTNVNYRPYLEVIFSAPTPSIMSPATQSKWGTYKNLGIDLKLF